MKRVYYHYTKWEDYNAGLYSDSNSLSQETLIEQCKTLLSDEPILYKMMIAVIDSWPHATEENLTNQSRNRRAWLGQAACCFALRAPEEITKLAWRDLRDDIRVKANAVADEVISIFELRYKIHLCPKDQLALTF